MQRVILAPRAAMLRCSVPPACVLPKMNLVATCPRVVRCAVPRRLMSSGPSVRQASVIPPWLNIQTIKKFAPQIAAVGGAVIVVYGLSRTMVYVTSSILSLDMYDLFYAGFWTGIFSVAVFATGGIFLSRMITINPKVVMRRALTRVQASPVAQNALGTNVKMSNLRAYTAYNGHISLSKQFGWVEPRAQVLFHVVGDKGEGMVSAEAVRHRGNLVFNLLALDTLAKAGKQPQLHILKGTEDKLHVKGQLRGFLQTERASFIQQDKIEDDEARIREQETLPIQDPEDIPLSSQR